MKAYHWRSIVAERDRLARLAKGAPAADAPDVKVTLPPRNMPPPPILAALPIAPEPTPRRIIYPTSTPGRAICVECTYYERRFCTNPRARDPVTGVTVEAYTARKNRESCGLTGRYWAARPAMPARMTLSRDDSEPMEYVPPVPVRRIEPFRLYERASLLC